MEVSFFLLSESILQVIIICLSWTAEEGFDLRRLGAPFLFVCFRDSNKTYICMLSYPLLKSRC